MNLKDRLELVNTSNNYYLKKDDYIEVKNEENVKSFFVDDIDSAQIISNLFKTDKNIIIASSLECDKELIFWYFKTLFPEGNSYNILSDLTKGIQKNTRNIIAEPSVSDFIKIFELIIQGYNGFVFGMNVKTFDKFIEILKLFIILNLPNMTEKLIDNLLGLSNSVVIYVNKDEEGLLNISDIAEITYYNDVISLNSLKIKNTESEQVLKEEVLEETADSLQITYSETDDSSIEVSPEKDEIIVSENEDETEKKVPEKINKYKLLKQKIKNKKENHTDI